jgi:hypothetical protein
LSYKQYKATDHSEASQEQFTNADMEKINCNEDFTLPPAQLANLANKGANKGGNTEAQMRKAFGLLGSPMAGVTTTQLYTFSKEFINDDLNELQFKQRVQRLAKVRPDGTAGPLIRTNPDIRPPLYRF